MKRKPRAMKVLHGTDQPCRRHPEPDLPLATETEPVDWLTGPEAVAEWTRITELLTPVGVLSAGDLTLLSHLCNMHRAAVLCWRVGTPPTASAMTQLRLVYAEFGLTPASRSKVGAGQKASESDPFDALMSG